jgi:G3E family GTPase
LPASIVRGKGVLHLVEQPEVAHVFQLVGARWSIVRGSPWVPADRVTRLVLIGLSDHSDHSDHSDVEAVDRMLQELHVDRQRSDPPDEELA